MTVTLQDLLAKGADAAPALSAPDRQTLDFAGLRSLISKTLTALNDMGIGRNDRVAILHHSSLDKKI